MQVCTIKHSIIIIPNKNLDKMTKKVRHTCTGLSKSKTIKTKNQYINETMKQFNSLAV